MERCFAFSADRFGEGGVLERSKVVVVLGLVVDLSRALASRRTWWCKVVRM